MKKIISTVLLFGILVIAYSQNDSIGEYLIYHFEDEYFLIQEPDTFWINSQNITIKFVDTVSIAGRASFQDDYNLTFIRETSGGFFNYDLSETSSFIDVSDSIYHDVRVFEINFGFRVNLHSFIPDDEMVIHQWYLTKINVFDAWEISTGKENIVVAVIDEGLFLAHDDIGYHNSPLENVFHNNGEDQWTDWEDPTTGNGIDDDPPNGNGKIDDWKGWNYRNYQAGPPPSVIEDNNVIPEQEWGFHGTAVSGVIAAKTNNAIDIAGIAGGNYADNHGGVKILPLKIFDWRFHPINGWIIESSSEKISAAIDYAVEMGAHIINMSFGVEGSYNLISSIKASIENAYNSNVLLVASAGNEGYNGFIAFPASDPHVIAVGATDQQDERANFSNCGDEMELTAPGVDVITLNNDNWDMFEGTSFSAPMVAGTAALLFSINQYLTNGQVRTILKNTAEKVGSFPYNYEGWNCTHGYGRVNTYYAVCEALETLPPITINSNTVWNEPVISLHNIFVETGNTLTITGKVYMGPEASLVIQQGAQVIVDGGTITNFKLCGYENSCWPGIEVWGDNTASQHPLPGNPCAQGMLVLKNGATIENAVVAVELWKPDDFSTTGGIIDATDSYFRNNVISVHALWYRNFNPADPNSEMDYYGTFTNCSFIIDDDYLGDKTFYKHVDLERVRGLKFYGCDFSLEHEVSNVSQWNHAIAAYNAGFHVLPVCTSSIHPCPEYDSCRFKGFDRAIGAFKTTASVYPILINSAHFNDNSTGIFLSGTDYAVVINNFIEVGYDDPYIGNCGFANGVGIDILTSNGFAVENNRLIKNTQAAAGTYAGIRVASCPSEHDIIYKNELSGLSYGNYAEGKNRSDPGDDITGIEYQCNYSSHNAVDFIVTDTSYSNAMIRGWHGSRETASGNVFSRYLPSIWHFRNEGYKIINWYYCDPCTDEEPVNIFAWQPEYFEKIISDEFNCPDHYGGGGQIRMTENEKMDREMAFVQNLNDFNSVKFLYESLVDGGNTESVLSDIQAAEPGDMWALRSQLLYSSPHLSQEVLRAVADRTDVFPDGILLEILSANPDELKRDTLLSYLEQKDNPLPQYMIEILRQAVEGVTYKTILLDEMARYHAGKTQAAQDLIRDVLFDTVFNPVEYRNRLGNMNNLVADRQIIGSYLSEKDTAGAMTLLNLLPLLYDLEGESLEDYNNYKTLVEMQVSWIAQGKMTHEPDSLEIPVLLAIAENGRSYAGNLSRNILEYAHVQHYCRCLPLIDTAYVKHALAPALETHMESQDLIISAKPNPGRTYVAFDYELPDDEATGNISISDVTGRAIHQIPVKGKAGQKVWNTTGVTAGMYYYTLKSSGMVKSGKLLIY